MVSPTQPPNPDAALRLTLAVIRAAEHWGLHPDILAGVLQVSPDTLAWMHTGDHLLDPRQPEWQLALQLVGAARALDVVAGDEATARTWLHSENKGLAGKPIDLLQTPTGLARVAQYLDAARTPANGF